MDSEHRPCSVHLHTLGTDPSQDIKIFEEEDQKFWVHIKKSSDDQYLIISTSSKETSEVIVLKLKDLNGTDMHRAACSDKKSFITLRKREYGIKYEVEHHDNYFYFINNLNKSRNNKLSRCSVDSYSNSSIVHWEDVRPYNPEESIEFYHTFENFIAIAGRRNSIKCLWIYMPNQTKAGEDPFKLVPFDEENFTFEINNNFVYKTNNLRFNYSSYITPDTVISFNMQEFFDNNNKIFTILKQKEVPNYNKNNYLSLRFFIQPENEKNFNLPVSLVCHKNIFLKKYKELKLQKSFDEYLQTITIEDFYNLQAPSILYGYGSYGYSIDPKFSFSKLPLLNRGIIYFTGHIRGGGELGIESYENSGKYLNKLNTFNDFVSILKYLNNNNITSGDKVCMIGRSAGGLLMGASINIIAKEEEKDQKKYLQCAVADVPFVDVINTMSDSTIPLTVTEWEEWGNPNLAKYYDYMKSYSPYDNLEIPTKEIVEGNFKRRVKTSYYPSILVSAGLFDPRVAYWEPAKWVAKMRALKLHQDSDYEFNNPSKKEEELNAKKGLRNYSENNDNVLLLKTDLSSGHFSASDRYKYLRETAFEYNFVIQQIKATEKLFS